MFHIPARGISVKMPNPVPAPPGASLGQDFGDAAYRLGLTVLTISPSQGVVRHQGGEHTVLFDSLRRVWEQSALEQRPAVVESFLRAALSNPEAAERTDFMRARDRLLLRLAPPNYAQVPGAPVTAPRWDLVPGHLSVFLVVDEPETMWTVLDTHLEKWSKTFQQLYANAIDNLRKRTDVKRQHVFPPMPVIRYYQDNDAFDAARALLLPELI